MRLHMEMWDLAGDPTESENPEWHRQKRQEREAKEMKNTISTLQAEVEKLMAERKTT